MRMSAARVATACKQRHRLGQLLSVLGDSVRNYATQGIAPRAMYTVPVHGMNLRELATFRTAIGAGGNPRTKLSSLTLKTFNPQSSP